MDVDDVEVDDVGSAAPSAPSSASSTLAPVAIVAPSIPASKARHGLSLLGGAVAGAALVVFVLGRQEPPVHSAGRGQRAPLESVGPVVAAPPLPAAAPSLPTAAPSLPAAATGQDLALTRESKAVVPPAPEVPAAAAPSRSTSRRLIGSRRAGQEPDQSVEQAGSAPSTPSQGGRAALPSSDASSFEALADTRE